MPEFLHRDSCNSCRRIAPASAFDVAADERGQELCVEAASPGCDVITRGRRLRLPQQLFATPMFQQPMWHVVSCRGQLRRSSDESIEVLERLVVKRLLQGVQT